jgi:hypothetical protein
MEPDREAQAPGQLDGVAVEQLGVVQDLTVVTRSVRRAEVEHPPPPMPMFDASVLTSDPTVVEDEAIADLAAHDEFVLERNPGAARELEVALRRQRQQLEAREVAHVGGKPRTPRVESEGCGASSKRDGERSTPERWRRPGGCGLWKSASGAMLSSALQGAGAA